MSTPLTDHEKYLAATQGVIGAPLLNHVGDAMWGVRRHGRPDIL